MHVFITGGAGFIGSHLTRSLTARGDQVTVFDNLMTGHEENRNRTSGARFVRGDITDAQGLKLAMAEAQPDVVVHMAAVVSTPLAIKQPTVTIQVNLAGTVNLLEAMRTAGVQRGFAISTEETYGPFTAERIHEDHPQRPFSPYGITKVAAEGYTNYYYNEVGTNVINIRTSWVYGAGYPRNRPDVSVIREALRGEETALIGGADQWLDFTYIDDLIDGVLLLLDAPKLNERVYHISGDEAVTFPDLVAMLRRYLPNLRARIGPGLLEYSPGGMRMPQKGALDTSRARVEVGYRPKVNLAEGMRRYVEYLRELERAEVNGR